MKKLNGNIYLKVEEVEKEIDIVKNRFRTSHKAILPKVIRYLDVEFIECIHEEAKNLVMSMNYLYGYGEEYTQIKPIIHKIQERFRDNESCEDTLQFMQYDLTQTERRRYRKLYENFLANIFLEECIDKFRKLI
tara:strand:- start:12640 stop:13041 length:402 start_codon:yes stop_codon:yes gene_type:complete